MTDPRYPIGNFTYDGPPSEQQRNQFIDNIEQTPARLRAAIQGLSSQQIETPYRDDGWAVRQVVHHVPESHMNAYIRFKLALTEDNPTIKPYQEDAWAKLADVKRTPIDTSLGLLDALHQRWVTLLELLKPEDFRRSLVHPESGSLTLEYLLQMYAWHGKHHVAHVTALRQRRGWLAPSS